MKKLLLLLFTVLAVTVNAQTRTVTGVVTSAADDEPLIGASVVPVGGEGNGTATDVDGRFWLQVPQNVTKLRVSYIGMRTIVVDITSGVMRIALESTDTKLDEVMVVAYGTAKRSAYTGSASVVKADKIENTVVTDVVSALKGNVAGVQLQQSYGAPGSEPSVRIRGIGSINASNSPLYVVDGVPFDGSINTINPEDVASMTVLKDAAAAALYGARGANGVILITTKKGQEGKARITIEANWGANSNEAGFYNTIQDPWKHYQMTYWALRNQYYYGADEAYAGNAMASHEMANQLISGAPSSSKPGNYQIFTSGDNGIFDSNGNFNPGVSLGYLYYQNYDGEYYWLTPDNWQTEPFRHGLRQSYTATISGGGSNYDFFASGSYLSDEGILTSSRFQRASARFSGTYQVNKWAKFGANMSYTNEIYNEPSWQDNQNNVYNTFFYSNIIAPIFPLYVRNANGEKMRDPLNGNYLYDYGYSTYIDCPPYLYRAVAGGANPIGSPLNDISKASHNTFNGKWFVEIKPIRDLTMTASFAYWNYNALSNAMWSNHYSSYAYYYGMLTQSTTNNHSANFQVLADYSKSFGKNYLDVLLGYESYYAVYSGSSVGGYNTLNGFDYTLSNSGMDEYAWYSGSRDMYSTRGIFGRVNYNWDGKYYGSVSYRRDASSRFAKNRRWGNFFSVSAGWDIAKEDFMQDYTNIDMLKLKASFGQQGNDNIGNYYAWANQYQTSWDADSFEWGIYQAYQGNPNLTWETSNAFNVGIDFSFFQGIIDGTLEYFQRTTSNMLYNKTVQGSAGYTSIPANIGSMRNNGIEFELRATPVRIKDFTWDINFNITYLKNKVIKLAPEYNGELINGDYIYREGDPVYQMYLVKYAGVDPETGLAQYWARYENGTEFKTTDYNLALSGDSEQSIVSNKQAAGNMLPPVYGGVGTTLRWKGIDASIQCAYQLGGKIYDYMYSLLMGNGTSGTRIGNYAYHEDLLNAWTETNRNTDVPRMNPDDQFTFSRSDRWLTNASYFGITNINVGYSFPTKLLEKIQLYGLRIYFAADNVALWSRRKGLDPRTTYTSTSYGAYSSMRTITGGIKLTF